MTKTQYDLNDLRKAIADLIKSKIEELSKEQSSSESSTASASDEQSMEKSAPPGHEEHVEKMKPKMQAQYGKGKGTAIAFATAHKIHNEGGAEDRKVHSKT